MSDNETGWVEDNGSYYYYDSNGQMATGWQKLDGHWYYLYPEGSMAHGAQVDRNFLGHDGRMVTDERWVNSEEDNSGTWYYVGSDEKLVRGWNKIGDDFHYFNYPGGSMTHDNTINGLYIDNSGKIAEGTGWLKNENTGDYYYFSDGEMKTGWIQGHDDSWYYLNDDGKMATGWIKDENGDWYYLHSDGSMATGWVEDDSGWYFLYNNGSMAHDFTADDGYHVDKSGKMVTGRGWQYVDDSWYYLKDDGEVATDWLYNQGNWYYLYPQGSMAEDTTIDGYYLDTSGKWTTNKADVDLSGAESNTNLDSEKTADEHNDKLKILCTTVDINKFTHDGKNQMEYLFMQLDRIEERHGLYDILGIYKYKDYDEAINDTWDEIDEIIADESTDDTRAIAEDERRLDSIGSGTLQAFGGYTETILGGTTAAGGAATVDPLAIAGGSYIVVDGTSNFSGGVSKVKNAIWGNNEGDTWNFMKSEYIKMSPKYGENIYNVTQVVAGCYSLNKDLSAIPSDLVKVYPRAKNIIRAENEGLEASTSVLDIGNKVVITTKTESGMILTRTVIDKAEDISTFDKASIGTDAYNTESSSESIK